MTYITMSTKELHRLRVIQDLVSDRTTPRTAARLLDVTPRQLRRLRLRYAQTGAAGLSSVRRGKPSNRTMPE